MKLTLISDDAIRLDSAAGPMSIESVTGEQTLSPFHMVAAGLAWCTLSVLHAWANHAMLKGDDLEIEIDWMFAEDPHRVGTFQLTLHWPSLPPGRELAAKRVAEMCAIHETLTHSPTITIGIAA